MRTTKSVTHRTNGSIAFISTIAPPFAKNYANIWKDSLSTSSQNIACATKAARGSGFLRAVWRYAAPKVKLTVWLAHNRKSPSAKQQKRSEERRVGREGR